MLPPWNNGMFEYWGYWVKTYDFCVWIKGFGINFDYFSINDAEKKPNIPSFQYSIIPLFQL